MVTLGSAIATITVATFWSLGANELVVLSNLVVWSSMTLSSESIVLVPPLVVTKFKSSDNVDTGALVVTSFDVVGGVAIVVVFSSVMSLVVVDGAEDNAVVGGARG